MPLATAAATLTRATGFLSGGLSGGRDTAPRAIEGIGRAKVIANALRELDRFLSILIDEVAADTAPPGLDLALLAGLRNTPNKLRLLRTALRLDSPDHARLRAIGRGRDCLFHTAGIVRRADTRGATHFTTGWTATRYARGDVLPMTARHLADICAFYDRVAAGLIAGAAR